MNNEVSNDSNNELNVKSNGNSKIIIVILTILLIGALGFIIYDKFINIEKPPVSTPMPTASSSPTSIASPEDANTIVIDDTIKLKEIAIPNYNEEINIDYNGNNYLIQIKEGHLFINNKQILNLNNDPISAQTIYVTNKYILFTEVAQDGESISYAINKNGNEIIVEDNNYQIHDIKVSDDNLEASGHIFCGLDGDCPDKDLIIQYDNNTITISPKN